MLAVRPVHPPRPSSSALRPSRSAWSRCGVFPFRRWRKDSMGGSRLARLGETESDITFCFGRTQETPTMRRFSKLITHVLSNPAKAARTGLAPRPAPSLANAQHDFSFGCAILKGCDRGGGLVERVDDG